jgi:hypothetical protein
LPRYFLKPSKICPLCGSSDVIPITSKRLVNIDGDRSCKACAASWTPPIPKIIVLIMLPLFVVFFVILVIEEAKLRFLSPQADPTNNFHFAEIFGLIGAGACIVVLLGKAGKLVINNPGVNLVVRRQ